MEQPFVPPPRNWPSKLAAATRGWVTGSRGESSFHVHFPVAIAVVGAAAVLHVSREEWCLLVLAITLVLAAEWFNSAVERLAKAVTRTENEHIAAALDIASGAVLCAGVGAAVVGLCIFLPRLWTGAH